METEGEREPVLALGDGPGGTTLVDARNGFNELSRLAMLWTVRHRWPAGARFVLNCYRHWAQLVIRQQGGDPIILHSREGVTQGDPLSMVVYGVALVPLAEIIRAADKEVLAPFYADDVGLDGPAGRNAKLMGILVEHGPDFGYFPEPGKSIHVCDDVADMAAAEEAFAARGLSVNLHDGYRYVGGFIGGQQQETEWVKPKVAAWVEGVRILAGFAGRYPQTAYAGLVMSLQAEWQYLQRTVPGVEEHMGELEVVLREEFIPALFGGRPPDNMRDIFGHSVKRGGLGILDPTQAAAHNYATSQECCGELVESLVQREGLNYAAHRLCVRLGSWSAQLERAKREEKAMTGRMGAGSKSGKHKLMRSMETGAWLTVVPDSLNGTELSQEEFRDNLRLRYSLRPIGLQERCDGCGSSMTIEHGLSCAWGGLVLVRHNDARDEWGALGKVALSPSVVTYEPSIYSGRATSGTEPATPAAQRGRPEEGNGNAAEALADGEEPEEEVVLEREEAREQSPGAERGDVSVHGFWKRGTTAIFDVRITNLDAHSHKKQDPHKLLAKAEQEKKGKYLEACLERRQQFTPLVFSADGMAGEEAKAAMKRMASLLSKKLKREYSEMCGYVKARMSLAVVRSNTLLLRGPRDKSGRIKHAVMMDGAGMALQRSIRT